MYLERSPKVWKKIGGIGNSRKNCDLPDNNIVEIGENTGDQWRLAVAQTSMKGHLLKPM